MGRALRRQLGGDPRAGPGALRRALPPHLARVSLVVRGDVPLETQPHASVPGHGEQGQPPGRRLPDEPRVPVSAGCDTPLVAAVVIPAKAALVVAPAEAGAQVRPPR